MTAPQPVYSLERIFPRLLHSAMDESAEVARRPDSMTRSDCRMLREMGFTGGTPGA